LLKMILYLTLMAFSLLLIQMMNLV
jgi:hypothetical protein